MALDPRALQRFLTVCREGSIGGAARRLHVTQPAVSATILQLEETLGTTLFTRSRTGITLTHTGVALRRRARANAQLPSKITLSKLGDARWVLPYVAGAFRRQVEALFVSTNTPLPSNVIRLSHRHGGPAAFG